MKTLNWKYHLIFISMILISCSDNDDINQNPVPIDDFYFTFTENGIETSYTSSSYANRSEYDAIRDKAVANHEFFVVSFPFSNYRQIYYEIPDLVVSFAKAELSVWEGMNERKAQFKLGMASSERRDQICEDIPNVLFEELFGSQNVGFLEETDSFWIDIDQRLLSDLDLSLFQLEYEVVENNKTKRYRTTLKKDNIYTQPSESFIEIISTEYSPLEVDGEFSNLFSYQQIVSGKGKVRLYADKEPETDTKDITFTFKLPVRELMLYQYGFNIDCD
ncbi:MAG: hypothetical protein MK226_21115 [Saprospiraceae bacterium]|nr:hypothetical protein [Saprospiraceae bacterium]